jgi:FMN phosphatase YigB (HAD superfamily)
MFHSVTKSLTFEMLIIPPIHTLIFDWGDTIMRDFAYPGAMKNWPRVEYLPGAEEALQFVAGKYACIIATGANHSGTSDMIAALKRVEAQKYFQLFFSSEELGFQKPDPRFFSAIISQCNLNPSETVMIGDLYEKDIAPAKKAGLQTIFLNEKKLTGNFINADAIINKMNRLIDLL